MAIKGWSGYGQYEWQSYKPMMKLKFGYLVVLYKVLRQHSTSHLPDIISMVRTRFECFFFVGRSEFKRLMANQ